MRGLYPPILPSSRPAHGIYDIESYIIKYALPPYLDFSNIGHAQVLITYQSNNSSVADTEIWPDGVIYTKNFTNSSVLISSNDLATGRWEAGVIYKIQVRFGSDSELWADDLSDLSDFAQWKSAQIEQEAFSEWSNVMISKAIDYPYIDFLNNSSSEATMDPLDPNIETSTRPQFYVEYISDYEQIASYRFILYDDNENELENSGNITFTQNANNIGEYTYNNRATYLSYQFKQLLQNEERYGVNVEITTVNGYIGYPDNAYEFVVRENLEPPIEGLSIAIEDTIYSRENGCIQLSLTCGSPLTGIFVVSRASEESSFEDYEDLYWLHFDDTDVDNTIVYTDFTIESGIKYRYAIQYCNNSGIRSTPILSNVSSVDFEYSYLYRDGIQLKLKFNNRISSFKHTVLRSKQDTLGSKYPYLTQNGNACYAEFPISGLISFHGDSDEQDWTFFTIGPNGLYYKDQLVISNDKFEAQTRKGIDYTISMDLTHNNFYVERKFREKVEEFLNDFNYKLFKSPSEGNITVALMNVSLSPKEELGRIVYEFSATAYEVYGHELQDLIDCGVHDTGEKEGGDENVVPIPVPVEQ